MTAYPAPNAYYDYPRYSTIPSAPPSGSKLYDLSYNDELLAIKVALRNQLLQNRLPSTPVGFPAFLNPSCSQCQSREFYQEVYTSDGRSKKMAKISFIAPRKSRTGLLQWTISVPARGSFGWQHDEDLSVIAHVQADAAILEDPNVGGQILANPRLIFKALADSLEFDTKMTISIGSSKRNPSSPTSAPAIVLLSTDRSGRTTATDKRLL